MLMSMFIVDTFTEIIIGEWKMMIINLVNVHYVERLVRWFQSFLALNQPFTSFQVVMANRVHRMRFIHVDIWHRNRRRFIGRRSKSLMVSWLNRTCSFLSHFSSSFNFRHQRSQSCLSILFGRFVRHETVCSINFSRFHSSTVTSGNDGKSVFRSDKFSFYFFKINSRDSSNVFDLFSLVMTISSLCESLIVHKIKQKMVFPRRLVTSSNSIGREVEQLSRICWSTLINNA